jgi:uroporphyrinogen-III decarboxylase
MAAIDAKHGAEAGDRLAGFDFARHNEEVRDCWATFNAGRAYRTPIVVGTNTRYFMFNAQANARGLGFRAYSDDPDVMFDARLRFTRWMRFNIPQDAELGAPARWTIAPDFQNYYEAAWLGCPVEYIEGQVPDTRPAFAEQPERVMEKGLPDPFGGLMGKARRFYEHFKARAAREEFLGRPIDVGAPVTGTDGVMTVACNLFGPEFVCETMASDPDRIGRLFAFITEATIARLVAWRRLGGIPVPQEGFGFADDSIALISTAMYRQHVLPHHRRLCDALATPGPRGIHLCGDATRHFVTLRDELNIQSFDTGFPVDFAQLRRELGPKVRIQGGPHVELLRGGTAQQVRDEVARITASGVREGGRFVLREANNLAPYTPLENIQAMYDAGRELGKFN